MYRNLVLKSLMHSFFLKFFTLDADVIFGLFRNKEWRKVKASEQYVTRNLMNPQSTRVNSLLVQNSVKS